MLAKWSALGLSAVAVVLAVAALVRTSTWDPRWGDIATWAAAVATFLTAVVAVGIAIRGSSKERREASARAVRRALRVTLDNSYGYDGFNFRPPNADPQLDVGTGGP